MSPAWQAALIVAAVLILNEFIVLYARIRRLERQNGE